MTKNVLNYSLMTIFALSLISTFAMASSSVDNNNITPITNSNTNNTSVQEVIFKTPNQFRNDSSKLEYKSSLALPKDSSWTLSKEQESTTQFMPKVIKKDDSNFLSILSSNQFPSNTVRIMIDKIDVVDVDSRFYRIPNIKTEGINDWVYVTKANSTLNNRPTAQEAKDYNSNTATTIYLTNIDGKYTSSNPEEKNYAISMVQEKVGNNDWTFNKALCINLTSNSVANQAEADNIVKQSKFDNEEYSLKAPIASNTNTSSSPNASQGITTASLPQIPNFINGVSNAAPWVATIAGFGLLNFGIMQYFKK
jgi:hypothetical protein